MGAFNLVGVYCIIPITIYLTISFFVLVVAGRTESKNMKTFGSIIAVLLWVCALLALIAGIWMMTTSYRPWKHHCKMSGKYMGMEGHKKMEMMKGRPCPMMPGMKK